MRKNLVVFALVLALIPMGVQSASSAGYSSCVAVNDAEIKKSFNELVYSVDFRDLCESGIRSYTFTFKSNKFSVSNIIKSYVILHGLSTTVDFSLSRFTPGDYSPTLEIGSSMDLERRTISLPRFNIESPIDCLQVTRSGLDISQSKYSVTIRNTCNTLNTNSFSNLRVELQGIGNDRIYSNSQSLYSVSNIGTTVDFNISGVAEGTYFPSLLVMNQQDSNRKSFVIDSFIVKKATTQMTQNSSSKRLCVSGNKYLKQCFDYPNFTYEICSSNQNGKVQFQSGSAWLFGWNFKGIKDLERCRADSPFLISIYGNSKVTQNMRLAFSKYLDRPAFYSNFKVTVV